MSISIDKIFVCVGLLSLAHAAYSAAQHRAYLRLTEQEFSKLPADILLQSLAGLLITCYGVVKVIGSFRLIRAAGDSDKKSWDSACNRQSFYTFQHRGRALFQESLEEDGED